jgi:hypothetical protein
MNLGDILSDGFDHFIVEPESFGPSKSFPAELEKNSLI